MKKRTIFALLLFSLVLFGCTGISTAKTKEQVAATADNVHTGFKGVTLEFVKNNPPDTVFTGSPLDIVVNVRNDGAVEVSGGLLYLGGYDSNLFNIQPRQGVPFSLDARTKFTTIGDYEPITFHASPIIMPVGVDTLNQKFQASACYLYRTEASIPVCIDPDPTSVLENEACKVVSPTVTGGQGGPVGITTIREDAIPKQVNFLITIANQGDGSVVDKASTSRCPSTLGFNDVDKVYYSVTMSGVAGDCTPVQKVTLSNKQGQLYCKFLLTNRPASAYQSVLEVKLEYGYLTQKEVQVKVKNLG
jgi:hypothetical protein